MLRNILNALVNKKLQVQNYINNLEPLFTFINKKHSLA